MTWRDRNHTPTPAPMQISKVALVPTQNTGAPINRSRTVPPPTPVTTAKKMKVTSVCFFSAASSAPEMANTAMPTKSSQRSGPGGISVGVIDALCNASISRAIATMRLA